MSISPEISTLPEWVIWLAQDANGDWWGYSVEPHESHNGWYENEVGRHIHLGRMARPADWRQTLQRVRQD